jgi:hypothetical protein
MKVRLIFLSLCCCIADGWRRGIEKDFWQGLGGCEMLTSLEIRCVEG